MSSSRLNSSAFSPALPFLASTREKIHFYFFRILPN
jgi:hypothetical protein